jgi:hypothetical protein
MAREIGEGLEWDPKDAKKWSKEDFEANCVYLLDRGGDVPGTTENEVLVEAITQRVGESKVEATLEGIYQRKFEEVEAPDPEEEAQAMEDAGMVPAGEFEPGGKKGGKK